MSRVLSLLLILTITFAADNRLEEFNVEITQMKKGVTFPNTTKVLVKSSIVGLSFDSNRGIIKAEKTGEGEWKLTLDPGGQRFEIKADGFLSYSERHNFEAGKAYECRVSPRTHELVQLDADLFEIRFEFNTDKVFCAKNNAASVMSLGNFAVFKLPEGEYTFTFSKNNYKHAIRTIQVAEDETVTIDLEEDASQRMPYVPPATVNIETTPVGAEIILNGIKAGTTNATIPNLSAGEHSLELRKDLYYSHVGTFMLEEGEIKTLPAIALTPMFGYLTVESHPAGADVFIDGAFIGSTPIVERQVESGEHSLVARQELYHDYREDFTIKDGKTSRTEFDLESSSGSISILAVNESGEEIADADVIVNGEFVGKTPFENVQYPSGKYTINVQKEYYNAATENVVLADNKSVKRTVLMKSNMSFLTVRTNGGIIFLNDRNIGFNEVEQVLQPGMYKLRVEKEGHFTTEKNIVLSTGKMEDITIDLEPIEGSLSILVVPYDLQSQGEVYVNNEYIGKAPQRITKLIGNYNIYVKIDDKGGYIQSAEVKEHKDTQVEFDFSEGNRSKWESKTANIGESNDGNLPKSKPAATKNYRSKGFKDLSKTSQKPNWVFSVGLNISTIFYNDKEIQTEIDPTTIPGVILGVERPLGPVNLGIGIAQRGAISESPDEVYTESIQFTYFTFQATYSFNLNNFHPWIGFQFDTFLWGTYEIDYIEYYNDWDYSENLEAKNYSHDRGVIFGLDYYFSDMIGARMGFYVGLADIMKDVDTEWNYTNFSMDITLLARR